MIYEIEWLDENYNPIDKLTFTVPIEDGYKITTDTGSGANTVLKLDKNGDGTIDEIIAADGAEPPNTDPPIITGPETVKYKGTITLKSDKSVEFTTNSKYITLKKIDDKTVEVISVRSFRKSNRSVIIATPTAGGDITMVDIKVKPSFGQWLLIIFLFGWIWM